jgi:hypothetical protein
MTAFPSGGTVQTETIQRDSFVAVGYGAVTGFPPPIITFDLKRRFL